MAGVKKRAKAPEKLDIVQVFTSSPIVYGPQHCKERPDIRDNPDFHAPIKLTSRGTFVDERNLPVDPKNVPEYVRAAAKKANLSTEFRAPRQQQGTLRDAMRQSGVQDPTGLNLNA